MDLSLRRLTEHILDWAEDHPRPMPWKETTDPYRIWISEVILQQTQVAQGLSFYRAFVRRFPTVNDLAMATEDEVLSLWQGLGYNSRARHMHMAAQTIVSKHLGIFPKSYPEIRALKGIGDYAAAAIASFAFGLSFPVLDSNVVRVISRVKGIDGDPAKRETRDRLYALLNTMIKAVDPAVFNQSIMNFGAMQCTPRRPNCNDCILNRYCVAFRDGLVDTLPMRSKRIERRERFFHYFLLRGPGGIVIRKRMVKDIWQQMYDFPMMETASSRMPPRRVRMKFLSEFGVMPSAVLIRRPGLSQTLTHQVLHCAFYEIRARNISKRKLPLDCRFVLLENLKTFAFPKVIRTFLTDNSLHLAKLLKKDKT